MLHLARVVCFRAHRAHLSAVAFSWYSGRDQRDLQRRWGHLLARAGLSPDGSVMHVLISQRLVLWGLCTAFGSSGDEWATAWVSVVAHLTIRYKRNLSPKHSRFRYCTLDAPKRSRTVTKAG